MKKLTYILFLLVSVMIISVSCTKKSRTPMVIEDDPVVVFDTVFQTVDGNNRTQASQTVKPTSSSPASSTNIRYSDLKRYSVVVATLTKSYGIEALKRFFIRDKIDHYVVQNPEGMYYFIIYTSDSEADAIDARARFLMNTALDKTRQDIWQQYYISITDAFILKK